MSAFQETHGEGADFARGNMVNELLTIAHNYQHNPYMYMTEIGKYLERVYNMGHKQGCATQTGENLITLIKKEGENETAN